MSRRLSSTAMMVLAALVLCLPVFGFSAYTVVAAKQREEALANLQTIADLKSNQIAAWLAERVGDANTLSRSAEFAEQVRQFRRTGDGDARQRLDNRLGAFRDALGYRALSLFDETGRGLLDVGEAEALSGPSRDAFRRAVETGEMQASPLSRDAQGHVHLDFVVPIAGAPSRAAPVAGVLVLRADPGRFLYPLLQAWPTASASGEILLLRKSADKVTFLNDLRQRPGSALVLQYALSEPGLAAAIAVRDGRAGSTEGVDYRGVPVLAAYRPVGHSDWMLLAKMDRAEALAPARELAIWVSAVAALALAVVLVAVFALLRQQRSNERLAMRAESQQMLEPFFHLPFIGMAVTSATTGQWLRFNDRLCEMLGYSREELGARTWADITHPDDRDKGADRLDAVLRGASNGYEVEKRLLRKDGTVIHCNVDVKCVRSRDGRVDHLLDTVDDITERKATENGLFTIGRYYAALSQCDEAIVRCTRESELFPAVCDAVVSVAGVGLAWIGMVDEKTHLLVPVAQAGNGVEYLRGLQISVDPRNQLSQGPTGTAVLENRPVWSEDFMHDPRTSPWHTLGARFGWRHSGALPLVRNAQVVGALTLYMDQPDALNDKVRRLLVKMVANISFALDGMSRAAERSAAIDALRRSESRFRQVFESSIDGILLAAPDGHVLSANQAACRMLGWSEAEMRALGHHRGLLDATDTRSADALEERHRTGRFAGELTFVRKDGSRMPGEVAMVEFDDSYGQKRSSVIFRDITERRRSEELLRSYTEQLAFYFSASPIVAYRLAFREGAVETVWVSDNIEAQLGYSLDEVLAPGWWGSHLHPDDRAAASGEIVRITTSDAFGHQYRFAHKDGHYVWIRDELRVLRDGSGTPVAVVGAWSDISARVQTEMELRKLSLAVEQSPESIVITDVDARIEYVNDTFLRVSGFAREEVIGRNPGMLQSGVTPRSTYEELWAALGRGEPWKGQFVNRRKDGSEYTEFAIIAPIRQNDGRITHYLAIKDDITERKRMGAELDVYRHHLEQLVATRTAELADARERAEAANLAKSAFLANMSHEIRTPMNAIIGLTHLMLSAGTTPEQATRLRKIASSGRHLLSLVNDILDLSKIEAGKLAVERVPFDLLKVVGDAFGGIGPRAEEKGLETHIIAAPDLPVAVRGDPLRLGQILLNLLSNAVKFTERGEVELRLSLASADAQGCVVRFDVTDSGIGLTSEQQARLFQAFEQADASTTRKYGGTGLGLAICQRLVATLGGRIGVASTYGAGSTFWFELPFDTATPAELPALPRAERGGAPAPGEGIGRDPAGIRILLVEDDPINQEVALELLRAPGYGVDVAVDGAHALVMAQARHYDLVLMDLQMPVMDGFEATRQLRASSHYARTPIIAMTANVFVDDQQRCIEAGMNDFIAKPVDPEHLLVTVSRWLGMEAAPSADAALPPAPQADWQLQLAHIDGLDVGAGLRAVRGRWPTLERPLRTFLRDHGDDASVLLRLLAAGDTAQALRMAHTLKGLAGTLGAGPLQDCAQQLERALRADSTDPQVRDRLACALAESLARFVHDIGAVLPPQTVGPAQQQVDWPRVRTVVEALERLLGQDDARALDYYDGHAAEIRAALGADAPALERHIQRFEFDRARELLLALLARGPAEAASA